MSLGLVGKIELKLSRFASSANPWLIYAGFAEDLKLLLILSACEKMAESDKTKAQPETKNIPRRMGIELVGLNETLDERLPSGPIITEANVFYIQLYRSNTEPRETPYYIFLVADRINLPLELLRSAAEVKTGRQDKLGIELAYAKGRIIFREFREGDIEWIRRAADITGIPLAISDRKLFAGYYGALDKYGVGLTEDVIAHVTARPY